MELKEAEHPLQRTWTLWFDSPSLHENYQQTLDPVTWALNIEEVYTFNTIEDFWRLYNTVYNPKDMWYKSAYYLFIEGTAPHCCDLNNRNGLTVHFNISSDNLDTTDKIDYTDKIENAWLEMILSLIGENLEHSQSINGASLNKYKNCYELTLWPRTSDPNLNQYLIDHFTKKYKELGIGNIKTYILNFDDKFAYE